MQKKGIEMSLNTIIIAAIGLLILVILAFLVVNYVKNLREGTETCNAHAGICAATCDKGIVDLPADKKSWDCMTRKDSNTQCCKIA